MKAVVIYKSETGFTKKYAEWIARELGADILEASKAKADMFDAYDAVIYGGCLRAAGISGARLIKNNLGRLQGKKIAVFATGASPPREGVLDEVINRNFTPEQRASIKFFYLRGGFDYGKLKPMSKFLMTLLKWKIMSKDKEKLTADEKGMLAAYDKPADFTKKENIKELIGYIRSE